LKLLDFTKEQQENAMLRLKDIKDIDLDFVDSKERDFWIPTSSEKNGETFQLYTDCRPFLIRDVLRKYDDDLLAICANALVLTSLTEIEDALKEKDFVFKERKTWFGLKNIEHIARLAKGRTFETSLEDCLSTNRRLTKRPPHPRSEYIYLQKYLQSKGGKLNLEQIVHLPISRVCLLGALGISNNPWTKETVEAWKKYILQERKSGESFFSSFTNSTDPDTYENDSFIRAYIEVGLSGRYGRLLTKKTDLWDGNIIDTTCTSDKIWFGKGSIKTGGGRNEAGKRYLKKLDSYIK
jgi:hypothetical protein